MKQIICVTLDENRIYTCSTNIIARSNENNTTQIAITLADCFCDYWVYIDFEKPDGTKVKTPKINVVDNVAIYDIPNSLVDLDGELKAQIVLQKENGEVWKSTIKTYHVKSSINATDDIPEKEDFITEAQSILDGIENAVTPTIGENGNWFIGDRDTGKSSEGIDGKDGRDGVDGKDYVITNEDYEEISSVVETNIQPTLENNLKESKDYIDNAITKDFKDISYNDKTATIVFTRHDNTTFTIDLPIEQTVKDGRYDNTTNELVLVLVSGQEIKIPVTGLIDDYDGVDTATIQCIVSADNKVSCNIKSGSVSKTLLTTDLQNEITNKVNKTSFIYDEETETLSISI